MAVGRLKSARETQAAAIIRKTIYESTPEVAAARDRVLERLETDAASWVRCEDCCHGRVHDEICLPKPCPACLGLGVVHR